MRVTSDIPLSDRDMDILELMGRGLSAAAMSEELDISIHTVRDHIKQVLAKLEASSQLEAVSKAIKALSKDNQ